MTNCFRIFLLISLLLKGLVGFSNSVEPLPEDSIKYLNYSNSSLLSHARKAADNDDFEEAKIMYLMLVAKDSMNPLYNYECGLNYFLNLFEQPKSLPYFQRALKYSTKDTIEKVYYYLGQAYQLNNRYDEAIDAYTHFKRFVKKNKKEQEDLNKKIEQCKQGKGYLATFNNVVNIDNLGNNINTHEAEYVPVVKNDESVMYFTARRMSNVGGEKDAESNRYFEDMFISKGENGVFHYGERFMIGDSLTKKIKNTGGHESVVSLSYDEKYLITYKNNSLWWSEWVNNTWSKPSKFSRNINMGEYQNHGSLSAHNDTFYFSSNASIGYGGLDIYMSVKDANGKWGRAKNLGPAINTAEDEDSPSIGFDNVTLYFSSKGHNSMGGYDVFKSVYSYEQWPEPLNLGMPINSAGDDIYFKYDRNKRQAYFSSSREKGFGDYDIYRLIDYNTPRFDDCQTINSLPSFPITLDAKKSIDVKDGNSIYHWEFSDGENAEGEVVTHDFKTPGKHEVKLYVLDPIVHTLKEEKDTTITILNLDKVQFSSVDTISIDSILTFNGAPSTIDNAAILKYHWSYGDSTAGSDSSEAHHKYASPGTYEVKLSMVARNDSTEKVFQKCVTKTVSILNKEEYMNYYLKSVARANKKKGFNSEMLGLTHLDFLAPDTTTITLENIFDAAPVFIPNSKILSYVWDFGDTLQRISTKLIKHSYDSIHVYKVNMNVIYQVDSTKGIYEANVSKNVVVVSPEEFQKMNAESTDLKMTSEAATGDKPRLDFTSPDTTTLSFNNVFEIDSLFLVQAKVIRNSWEFGKLKMQKSEGIVRHTFDSLGVYPVKLNVLYEDKKTKDIVETSVTKNVEVVSQSEFDKINTLRTNKISKSFETSILEKSNLDFFAPDTTTLAIKNTFDSKPLSIANSNILKFKWKFGDSTEIKPEAVVIHSFDTLGYFPVELNVVYQNKETKGIYETTVKKNVAVVDTLKYSEIKEQRKNKAIKELARTLHTSTMEDVDTSGFKNIELENIYFDYDKFNIRPDAKAALLRNIIKLGADSLLAIKVSANTDSRGSKAYNFKLSAKRAISAINFMAANNIERARIIAVVSEGETNLVNRCGDNIKCSEKEHQLNRRDEFKVVGKLKKQ